MPSPFASPPGRAVASPPAVKRRLVTLAAAVSLLLCVATVALWVRSYCRLDSTSYVFDRPPSVSTPSVSIHSLRGRVELVALSFKNRAPPEFSFESGPARQYALVSEARGFLGFYWVTVDSTRVITFPHWFLALLLALLPALHLRALFRSRGRDRAGRCPRCGYDVRATPGRCPECGAVPAAPAAR